MDSGGCLQPLSVKELPEVNTERRALGLLPCTSTTEVKDKAGRKVCLVEPQGVPVAASQQWVLPGPASS